jgi:hypothetical protein
MAAEIARARVAPQSWHIVLRRALDASLLAAVGIAVLDWSASVEACPEVGGLGQTFLVLLVVASVLAALLFGTAQVALRHRSQSRWPRVVVGLVAGAALAGPSLLVLRRPLGWSGACLFALAAATFFYGFLIGRRTLLAVAWLAGALVAGWATHDIMSVLALRLRIDPGTPDLWLLLAVLVQAGGLALCALIYGLVRACAGWPLPRLLSLATVVVAAGAWLGVNALVPATYARVLPTAYLGVGVLAALGTSCLVIGGTIRLRLIPLGAAWLGLGVLMSAQPLATVWRFSTCSSVGRAVDSKADVIRFITWPQNAALRHEPEFVRGMASATDAVLWNRRPVSLSSARPLSFLLVTCESLRYDMVGYSGRVAPGTTPTLDALADRAQRFHHAYANGGWTSLSIPSLMWSRHAKDITLVKLYEDRRSNLYFEDEIPAGVSVERIFYSPRGEANPSLARVLHQAGFVTAAVPNDGNSRYFDPRLEFTKGFEKIYYPRKELEKAAGVAVRDVPDRVAVALATAVLRAYRDDRFFLWVHLFDAHLPHESEDGKKQIEGFRGEIRSTDSQLARLLRALDDLGRSDDTVVAVMGDHGEDFRIDPNGLHGLDLRDDSMRVALLVAIPNLPGRDFNMDVGLIDVAPTLLALAGVKIPDSMQGQSLVPWIADPTLATAHLPVLMETRRHLLGDDRPTRHITGAVADHRKVVHNVRNGITSCYELDRDPQEDRPIPSPLTSSARCRSLAAYLQGWAAAKSDSPGSPSYKSTR